MQRILNKIHKTELFYHIVLKCYVVIDLKTKKLTHADLGQMLLYVNYFDEEIKNDSDNPTIGLILCTKKSDAMVKYMLTKSNKFLQKNINSIFQQKKN